MTFRGDGLMLTYKITHIKIFDYAIVTPLQGQKVIIQWKIELKDFPRANTFLS